jgi:hypothetical protein
MADTARVSVSSVLPGAVSADPPDQAVAGHLGDPTAEQRAAERDVAVVDRSHRGVVLVEGPDRLDWLHQLTTQALTDLPPGVPTETLVLSPHGHVEHHIELIDDGARTWLLLEPGDAAPLATWLDRMRFLTRVDVREESDRWAMLTLLGPNAAGHLAALEPALIRPRRWPDGALDLLIPRADAGAALAALAAAGVSAAGHDAFEALRVAGGHARLHVDTDAKTLVHEAGWITPALHLAKGCYRGQETVARVHNLGRPPRRLVQVHLDGSGVLLAPRGTLLTSSGQPDGKTSSGQPDGRLTSVVRHHELGPIGLAVLKSRIPLDAPLVALPEEGEPVAVAIERDLSSPTAPVDLSGIRPRR